MNVRWVRQISGEVIGGLGARTGRTHAHTRTLLGAVCRQLEVGGGPLIRHILALLLVAAKVGQAGGIEIADHLELRAREDADTCGTWQQEERVSAGGRQRRRSWEAPPCWRGAAITVLLGGVCKL